jgi:hypothetical protein
MYKSPLYHYDGLGYADVLQPSYTPSNLNDGHQTSNFLYHSSRLVSLIQNANTSLFYFHFSYLAGARNADQAFAIFRYDPEGFRVYISLDLTDDRIELCSGENKIGGGGAFPSYPIYRPKINTEAPQRNAFGSEDATALLVGGETYYVEAQSGFAANLFDYSVVGTSYDVDYATDVATNFSGAYGNSAEFNNRSAGYGISAILTTESGSASIDPNIILDTRSKLHHGYDLHEVSKDVDPSLPTYGNFTQNQRGIISAMSLGTSPVLSNMLIFPNDVAPLTTLFTPRKDTQERFLDESYRLSVLFEGIEDQQNIQGPGLPQGSRVNLLRVRDDVFATSVHGGAGYLRNSHHWDWCVFTNNSPFYDGNGNLYNKEGEAQVSGLPSLALAPLNGGEYGVPRRGLLRLPILNYQVDTYFPNETYDPSWTTGAMGEVGLYYRQPDYNHGVGGTYYNREFSYSRAFDVEFSRSGTVENMKGTSRFQMRVLGLSFSDFAFKSDRGVSIYVKIPGLTAWLDVGRANNQGVSKQHISKDGSGCLISEREGFTVKENVYFTDLTLELGPLATFAKNSTGECPVLVKVSFKGLGMEGYDNSMKLDFEPGVNPPAMSTEYYPVVLRRGLVGLEILRMSNGKNYDEDEVVYV